MQRKTCLLAEKALLHDRPICGILILNNWEASNTLFKLPRASGYGCLGWEDPLEEGKAPLQYSGLENSMDYIAHGLAKSQT